MNVRQPGMGKSRRIDDLQRLRLMVLLDDLVGENAVRMSTAHLDVGQRTLTASPENERLTQRMRVALEDIKGKLSRREMLRQMRLVLNLGMWRKWRQRAGGGFQLAFVSSIEK